jgi:hypothetical protein
VRNARALRLVNDSHSLTVHVHQCSRLAAAVPVFRLMRRHDLNALPDVIELVKKDLAECK